MEIEFCLLLGLLLGLPSEVVKYCETRPFFWSLRYDYYSVILWKFIGKTRNKGVQFAEIYLFFLWVEEGGSEIETVVY